MFSTNLKLKPKINIEGYVPESGLCWKDELPFITARFNDGDVLDPIERYVYI